jgi:predicted DNA-binding transcriptional regulator YafY
MPITRKALIRYQTLDRCFRNSARQFSVDELLVEVNRRLHDNGGPKYGINKRQLYYDIQFLESEDGWSAPIKKYRDGRKVYYKYADSDFSINNQPLHEIEAEQIETALNVLSRFSGAPQFEVVHEMVPKLRARLGLDQVNREVVSLDANLDLAGIEHLTVLYHSICNKVVLNVTYRDFRGRENYEILFHPYYLKQYNNRWFVFGLNEVKMIPNWNLALDRIVTIDKLDNTYIANEIDWNEYFYEIIGVTNEEKKPVEEVQLEFSNKFLPYVRTKPLHPTQRELKINGKTVISIKVKQNYELESVILSFGEHVQVLGPESLQRTILVRKKRPFSKDIL